MVKDDLTRFLDWFLHQPVALLGAKQPEGEHVIINTEKVLAVCIYREAPYQVEMVIAKPNMPAWPGEHRHPDVDAYEVALYNNFDFTKNGEDVTGPEYLPEIVTSWGGVLRPACVRLTPSDWHGARPKHEGAVLLSVQRWLNNVKPSSVGLNWEGEPTSEDLREQQQLVQKGV